MVEATTAIIRMNPEWALGGRDDKNSGQDGMVLQWDGRANLVWETLAAILGQQEVIK